MTSKIYAYMPPFMLVDNKILANGDSATIPLSFGENYVLLIGGTGYNLLDRDINIYLVGQRVPTYSKITKITANSECATLTISSAGELQITATKNLRYFFYHL